MGTEPPPWARGAVRPPGPARNGPASPKSPTIAPSMRPGFPPQGPPVPGQRPLQPGDVMRGAPILQPYRPPQPQHGDSFRGPPPVRAPVADPYRGPAPRQPIRPQNSFTSGPQAYPGPQANAQSHPMRGQRPPVTSQMIQNQMNNNQWSKESDPRRFASVLVIQPIIIVLTLFWSIDLLVVLSGHYIYQWVGVMVFWHIATIALPHLPHRHAINLLTSTHRPI